MDVGQGAMDDGGGLFSAWEAANILMYLIRSAQLPRPARTIRVVLWVDEEIGQRGAATYAQDYASTMIDHVAAFESDSGNFDPLGFGFTGCEEAMTVMQTVLSLLESINATQLLNGGADADNGPLGAFGVPLGSMHSQGFIGPTPESQYYFNYHHSNADTVTAMDYNGLARSVAAYAVVS